MGFRIPKYRIPDSTSKNFRFRNPYSLTLDKQVAQVRYLSVGIVALPSKIRQQAPGDPWRGRFAWAWRRESKKSTRGYPSFPPMSRQILSSYSLHIVRECFGWHRHNSSCHWDPVQGTGWSIFLIAHERLNTGMAPTCNWRIKIVIT